MSNESAAGNGNNGEKPSDIPAQNAQVLWDEYKYRHELVWRVMLQITTAAVILSIAPYLAPKILFPYLGLWLLAAPVLAFVLVSFSFGVVNNELNLLSTIRSTHRHLQHDLFRKYGLSYSRQQTAHRIKVFANVYLGGLAMLSAANIVACGLFWIHGCVICRMLACSA
jgi:hypothetical protein